MSSAPEIKHDFEIAIVGGGISGLTLAIALHHRGVKVKIYEAAPKFGEIGAGVSFTPNAVQAMQICHQGIYEAFEKVVTRNIWPSKQKVWFDVLNGAKTDLDQAKHQESEFTLTSSTGQAGVHRAHFLDAMLPLLPPDLASFGKRLENITEGALGRLRMHFEDGTTAETDCVLGTDGIKSATRRIMFGADHPCANPTYTHKYAYRGLVPMDQAIEAVGEERAQNACMWFGPDSHALTFAVAHGTILNIVAFSTDPHDWPDYHRLTRSAKQSQAMQDFERFGPNVKALLALTKPDLDCWAIFHLGDNPVPQFNKGRVCLVGDAAHATSPHHGAGAGMCIEDAAVLASLLTSDGVKKENLDVVLEVFDSQRRERGQWLVQSSRFAGEMYEWQADGIGRDFTKIEQEMLRRNGLIANVDVSKMCDEAVEVLKSRLSKTVTV